MICQRCGNCCVTMDVVIHVNGKAYMKSGGACPYLRFSGNEASCAAHDEPWYKGSPCDIYGNPDYDPDFEHKRGKPCPVGKLIQERGGLRPEVRTPILIEDLAYLGPWVENV
jgi:hypothetical protein